jgi:osmotically-inducible protein OsmY
MIRTTLKIAGIVLAGAMVVGCQSYREGDSRTVGELTDDVGIHTAVKTALIRDPEVKGLLIDVDVHRGSVSVYGRVPSTYARERVVAIAGEQRGVTEVLDKLTLTER